MSPSNIDKLLTIMLIVMTLTAIYYIFFDQSPKSTGVELDEPPSWCSGVYCD